MVTTLCGDHAAFAGSDLVGRWAKGRGQLVATSLFNKNSVASLKVTGLGVPSSISVCAHFQLCLIVIAHDLGVKVGVLGVDGFCGYGGYGCRG